MKALSAGSEGEKTINLNGICLRVGKAVKLLRQNEYLDDLIIDFFIELAKEVCGLNPECGGSNKYCILSSLFYTMLNTCGDSDEEYTRLRKWIKRVSTPLLFNDAIVIPMHCSHSSHWWLIIICHPRRVLARPRSSSDGNSQGLNIEDSSKGWIVCLDSLGDGNISQTCKKKAILKILRFLQVESQNNSFYSEFLDSEGFSQTAEGLNRLDLLSNWVVVYNPRNLPCQENNFDCGIYIIEYAHWLFHCGTGIFNSVLTGQRSSGEPGENKTRGFNRLSTRWFQNRRTVYTRVLNYIGLHSGWADDAYLRNRLIEIFDDSASFHADTSTTSKCFQSSQIRRRFVMSSLNKRYFEKC
ncbi:ULP1 like protease [Cryptosporidium felis]|nr:ULP1 like protease [Cryptosporidium felis]